MGAITRARSPGLEIVLLRHAQPDWEPGGLAVDDPGLTPLGHAQAECAARALDGVHFDAVYRSPLQRVVETAEPIVSRHGVEVRSHGWLRELGLPSLAGQTSEQVQDYFANAHARALHHWWDGLPGGESFRHFYERVSSGLEGLLAGEHRVGVHEDAGQRLWRVPEGIERILIVAHEGTNAVLLSHLLGIEPVPWTAMRFSSGWAGISRIHTVETSGGAIWALESFNRIDHLAELSDRQDGDGRTPTL
jgi:probable phosphoglycerate mutase